MNLRETHEECIRTSLHIFRDLLSPQLSGTGTFSLHYQVETIKFQ